MKAIEFLNIILPEHDRTSCSDEDITNGFWSMYGTESGKDKWMGRCRRCMALQIIKQDEEVPKETDLSDLI